MLATSLRKKGKQTAKKELSTHLGTPPNPKGTEPLRASWSDGLVVDIQDMTVEEYHARHQQLKATKAGNPRPHLFDGKHFETGEPVWVARRSDRDALMSVYELTPQRKQKDAQRCQLKVKNVPGKSWEEKEALTIRVMVAVGQAFATGKCKVEDIYTLRDALIKEYAEAAGIATKATRAAATASKKVPAKAKKEAQAKACGLNACVLNSVL